MHAPFDSGDRQALARNRWPILVSLFGWPVQTSQRLNWASPHTNDNRGNPLPAGNSSPLLALNWMSFGVVAPTSGRYGSVMTCCFTTHLSALWIDSGLLVDILPHACGGSRGHSTYHHRFQHS